jgi:hypothetical protein
MCVFSVASRGLLNKKEDGGGGGGGGHLLLTVTKNYITRRTKHFCRRHKYSQPEAIVIKQVHPEEGA